MNLYEPVKIFDPGKTFSLVRNRTFYFKKLVENKSVLHIGCTDYPVTEERLAANSLLHKHLEETASYILGIDNSIKGIELKNLFESAILFISNFVKTNPSSIESDFFFNSSYSFLLSVI